ncbi:MAG: hypothetical protein Q4F75_07500 [Pseudomonadota bacterium]|nr:hypothetical protein [Pseudomonadota bacterium]
MNINLKFLLLGTSLSLIPTLTNAQCVASTDCATLGYTEKSCPDGKGIRCPFGTTFACPMSETKFCDKYDFKYECKGSGYASGGSKTCNGKYNYCTCTESYEWKDEKCQIKSGQCSGYARNCKIADILNSDGSCTSDFVPSKTPIGVVVYISGSSDRCGYAITPNWIAINIPWSTEFANTNTFQITNWKNAIKDFDVSGNMANIIQYAENNHGKEAAKYYPAAYAALNYAPSAAPETKGKWALPTTGILNSLLTNLDDINYTISRLGERQVERREYIWSSNEYSIDGAWLFSIESFGSDQGGIMVLGKNEIHQEGDTSNYSTTNTVRPVLAF